MATGYVVSGRGDLDTLFMARSSSPAAATGFLSNGGVDLNQRFEPRGATTAIANTNLKSGATDLAQIFKDISASGAVIPPISGYNVQAFAVSPFNAIAGFYLESDGDIVTQVDEGGGAGFTDEADWIAPKSAAPGAYQARATVTTGTTPGGSATGTFLALTSTLGWSLTRTTNGTTNCTLSIDIRLGTGAVLWTFTVTLLANKSF